MSLAVAVAVAVTYLVIIPVGTAVLMPDNVRLAQDEIEQKQPITQNRFVSDVYNTSAQVDDQSAAWVDLKLFGVVKIKRVKVDVLPYERIGEFPCAQDPLGRRTASAAAGRSATATNAKRGEQALVLCHLGTGHDRSNVDVWVEDVLPTTKGTAMQSAVTEPSVGTERKLLHWRTNRTCAEPDGCKLLGLDCTWGDRHRACDLHAVARCGLREWDRLAERHQEVVSRWEKLRNVACGVTCGAEARERHVLNTE